MKKWLVMSVLTLAVAGTVAGSEDELRGASNGSVGGYELSASGPPQIILLENERGLEKLSLFAGKSIVVSSPTTLQRVSVTDPAVASTTIVAPTQVLIHGQAPGSVTLLLWDEQDRLRSFDLEVTLDLSRLQETIRRVLPDESIEVNPSGNSIVITGKVSSKTVTDQATALATAYSENVVNLLVEETEQVLLQVRFAEVDRTALKEWGFSLFSTGAANTHGAISTQQFSQTAANVGAVPADVQRGRDPTAPNLAAGGKGVTLEGNPAVFGLSDLLNVFLFRPDVNLGVVIRALQQHNMLEILAEPNLLAQNGSEASFLAGGEFPFPAVQSISGTTFPAVSIQFREFGIRVNFTPTISKNGVINLKVVQEVSALDYSNALTISGFVVPALASRRAETELQLRDRQSFAIAGLIDNRLIEVASKIPGLGDIPLLGTLFRSRSMEQNNTELLLMVTPQLVQPQEPGAEPAGPEFPRPFLDKEEFDAKNENKPSPKEVKE